MTSRTTTPSTPPTKRFVRFREAAVMYSVSVDTLRRAVRDGHLPHIKYGHRTVLLDVTDLDAYFQSLKVA